MPSHLRALLVLLPMAIAVLFMAKFATSRLIAPADFARRQKLWIGVTLIAFLAHNFWVYIIGAGLLLYASLNKEQNKVALYFLMLFAVPAVSNTIPGFGIVNNLFPIDYLRLLSLVILAPAAYELYRNRDSLPIGKSTADKWLIAYVVLIFFLVFLYSASFTGFLRRVFLAFLDMLLPYYVASRGLKTRDDFRDALMCFVIAAMILGLVGMFESVKGWILYATLGGAFGMDERGIGVYLKRATGDDGDELLRAQASAGHAIPFGYAMAVGIGFWMYAKELVTGRIATFTGWVLLLLGLYASVSRGPWLGAMLIVPIFILLGPRAGVQFSKLLLAAGAATVVLMSTEYGAKVMNLLPFVGGADTGSVSYRQLLLETLIPIVLYNPIFGASDFLYSPEVEVLRTGEGIIDLVNTYLSIALYNGLVGLGLFLLFFLTIGGQIFRVLIKAPDKAGEDHRLGRALLATLICILVIIATVSSIFSIAYIYWAVAGVGVAYCQFMQQQDRLRVTGADIPDPLPR